MVVPASKDLLDLSKQEPLDEMNFKHWSQKLLIFFEQLEVDYILFTNPLETPPKTSVAPTTIVIASQTDRSKKDDELKGKYDKDKKTVRDHLLNHMTNTLFELFVDHKSAMSIWNKLESRYGGDDAS
ncbi:UNVERIFIED_CONTAM: hypothetical protein Sradi_4553100 [Sesamum radiatum]|uniref:Ty1-copia retrotransposon protein n=1 Tax=Sesamum radiatum TaxID=300843 RepID=A0AAW2NB60_SESRA